MRSCIKLKTFGMLTVTISVILVMVTLDINTAIIEVPQPHIKKLNVNQQMVPDELQFDSQSYVINTTNCQIPDFDPFDRDLMDKFDAEEIDTCPFVPSALVYAVQNFETDTVILNLNESKLPEFNETGSMQCCYQSIFHNWPTPDGNIQTSYGPCKEFETSIALQPDDEYVLVKCHNKFLHTHKIIYKEIFAFARKKVHECQQNKTPSKAQNNRPINVLLLGIDSISRLNLLRTMPKTVKYLQDNNWFQMYGYNKVGENTYPNLMAVLSGLRPDESHRRCYSTKPGFIEKCHPIWMDFNEYGYLTAYAEDLARHATFHNGQGGFTKQPTNYYMRPFTIAAETHFPEKSTMLKIEQTCIESRMYAEYIYQYAIDLARINRKMSNRAQPYFGLFWTNSFSHDTTSKPLLMDSNMVEYFKQLEAIGTLNDTVVVFFSDHGMRYGYSRFSSSGYFEERLPFLFVYLPQLVKDKFPSVVHALEMNQYRLTTPYDLYLTLKHILTLNDTHNVTSPHLDWCPLCQSLFVEVPENRSCEDVAIDAEWCTCPNPPFISVATDEPSVQNAVAALMAWLNNAASKFLVCSQLTLVDVMSAKRSSFKYLITIKTTPGNGIFEAVMQYDPELDEFVMTGTISRLTWYMQESYCIKSDWVGKKICYCDSNQIQRESVLNATKIFAILVIIVILVIVSIIFVRRQTKTRKSFDDTYL